MPYRDIRHLFGRTAGLPGLLLLLLLGVILLFADLPSGAQDGPRGPGSDLWSDTGQRALEDAQGAPTLQPLASRALSLDAEGMRDLMSTAPAEDLGAVGSGDTLEIALPAPDGTFKRFAIQNSPIMEAGLAAAHPEIQTFVGRGIDDPESTVRLSQTSLGFAASVRSAAIGAWYIDRYVHLDQSTYISFFARDVVDNPQGALVENGEIIADPLAIVDEMAADTPRQDGSEVTLRIYRLALLSDPAYATFHEGQTTAAKVELMNRVTQIYEDETAIRMLIIAGNDAVNLDTQAQFSQANGPCGTAPCFTTPVVNCSSGTLNRNRIVLGTIIGAEDFDIGHIILGAGGGGIAQLNAVGGDGKARGCTGLPEPTGDFFAVDYVAHEMGHQYGGPHTFNGSDGSCGANIGGATSVEPGSGSSIMAYAGICAADNLQSNSDPQFSHSSFEDIMDHVTARLMPIRELQNVSLRSFDADGDAFTLAFDGSTTAPFVRGTNYTAADIKAGIEGLASWPPGGTVTVTGWGASGAPSDIGFAVAFGGSLATTDVSLLTLAGTVGDVAGFANEIAEGGPVTNQGDDSLTGNFSPIVAPVADFTIPYRTPFALTGTATDADDDALTYLWEQTNPGTNAVMLLSPLKNTGPLFRIHPDGLGRTTTLPSTTTPT